MLIKFHWNWTTKSKVIHVRIAITKQYQMSMSSLARVKFIKTLNMIRKFLGIIPKVPQTKFHQIRTTKSKVVLAQIPVIKWKKQKNGRKSSWVTKRGNKWLQIGVGGIANRGSFRDLISWQKGCKLEQGFQIEAKISNQGKRDFKSRHGLQIGAEHGVPEGLI